MDSKLYSNIPANFRTNYGEGLIQQAYFCEKYHLFVKETADFLNKKLKLKTTPAFAIQTRSGLGYLTDIIKKPITIPYQEIPNFEPTQIETHKGELIYGKIQKVPVIVLAGRKHFYELGMQNIEHSMKQAVLPVNVMAELKIPNLFVTNAAGALNTSFNKGDIMIITSHINTTFSPLLGPIPNLTKIDGKKLDRFVKMGETYDPALRRLLGKANTFQNHIRYGTYLSVTGPQYETLAEVLAFRQIADAVGMSTTYEVIAGINREMNIVGFSLITNTTSKNGMNNTTHNEVTETGLDTVVKTRVQNLMNGFFKGYFEEIYSLKNT